MKVHNILETIGNTPHVKINRLYPENYEVFVKLEKQIREEVLKTGLHYR